jgi:hypothetical protein
VQINVELTPGVARWAYGGVEEDGSDAVVIEAPGGPLDVSDPAVHAAVSAAAATGALTITDGEAMPGAVEPDEVSLERLAVAQEARAPLYEARDRALHRLPRLPEVVMRSREEVEALADEGSGVHRALLREADDDQQEFAVPALDLEAMRELGDAGSEYHAELVAWEDRMAEAAQAAVEELG